MKDKFFYITLVVFLAILGITGYTYYSLSQKTPAEYDVGITDERNEVISQIDSLTNTLNTSEDLEEIQANIDTLSSKNLVLKQAIEEEETPETGDKAIVTENEELVTLIDSLVANAQSYKDAYENEDADPIEAMTSYNETVNQINQKIEEIKSTLGN